METYTVVLFIALSGGAYSICVYCHGDRSLLLPHIYVAFLCLCVCHVLLWEKKLFVKSYISVCLLQEL